MVHETDRSLRQALLAGSILQVTDYHFMRLALRLARRGLGRTSPNPMVGAVLTKRGEVIGQGWHREAGGRTPRWKPSVMPNAKADRPRGQRFMLLSNPAAHRGELRLVRMQFRRLASSAW